MCRTRRNTRYVSTYLVCFIHFRRVPPGLTYRRNTTLYAQTALPIYIFSSRNNIVVHTYTRLSAPPILSLAKYKSKLTFVFGFRTYTQTSWAYNNIIIMPIASFTRLLSSAGNVLVRPSVRRTKYLHAAATSRKPEGD